MTDRSDIRRRIAAVLREHQYENQCAAWNCDCGESFGPGPTDPVTGRSGYREPYQDSDDAWADHVTEVLLGVLDDD